MRQDQRAPLLVFIHVPKSAGTTVRTMIRTNEPGERNRKPGPNMFRGGGGINLKVVKKLRNEPQTLNLDPVRVLRGHHPLGIRAYLEPAFPDREFRYFTFMRNPVERALSHYFQVVDRGIPLEEDESEEELPSLPPETTFEEALEAGYLYDNLHTRMLCGVSEPFGDVTDDLLDAAKRNLEDTFALVGLAERMDESLVLAKQRLGFRSIFVDAERVNPRRPRGRDVPDELRAAAERHNRYDVELYHYAENLFGRAPELAQLDFQIELAALRAAKAGDDDPTEQPAPPAFHGGDPEWRMLLDARVRLLGAERSKGLRRVRGRIAADTPETGPPPRRHKRTRQPARGLSRIALPEASSADATRTTGRPAAVLVLIEIPGCGGGVIEAGLPANRPRRPDRTALDDLFMGGGGIGPRDMKRLRRATKRLRVGGLRLLHGEFPVAIGDYLAHLESKRTFSYVTFLRDPVARALEEGMDQGYDNLQTRMLSGSEVPFGPVTHVTLEHAKRSLRERFSYFGLAERLDESLMLARYRLGWDGDLYGSHVTAPSVGVDASPEARAAAERDNRYDVELHRYALELFDEAPELRDLEFQVELAVVRAVTGRARVETLAPPESFDGGEEEWRLLIEAKTELVRLERDLAADGRMFGGGAGNGAQSDEAPDG